MSSNVKKNLTEKLKFIASKVKENEVFSLVSDVLTGKEGRLAQGLGIGTAAFAGLMLSGVAAGIAGMAFAAATGNIAALGSAALNTLAIIGIGGFDIAGFSLFTAALAKKDGRVKAKGAALNQSLKAKLAPHAKNAKNKFKTQAKKNKVSSTVLDVFSGEKGEGAQAFGVLTVMAAAITPLSAIAVPSLTAIAAVEFAACSLITAAEARKHDGCEKISSKVKRRLGKKKEAKDAIRP